MLYDLIHFRKKHALQKMCLMKLTDKMVLFFFPVSLLKLKHLMSSQLVILLMDDYRLFIFTLILAFSQPVYPD